MKRAQRGPTDFVASLQTVDSGHHDVAAAVSDVLTAGVTDSELGRIYPPTDSSSWPAPGPLLAGPPARAPSITVTLDSVVSEAVRVSESTAYDSEFKFTTS